MIVKAVISMLMGFVLSVFGGMILIPFLKKIKVSQSVSIYLNRTHKNKEGTPTMGGLIFLVPSLFIIGILLLTGKIHFSYTLVIIIFTLLSYMIIGFIDDYLIVKRHNNEGLSRWQKLAGQIVIATIFFYLFMEISNYKELDTF